MAAEQGDSKSSSDFNQVIQDLKKECPDCFFSTRCSQSCHTSSRADSTEDSNDFVEKCETIKKIYKQCPNSAPELVYTTREVTEELVDREAALGANDLGFATPQLHSLFRPWFTRHPRSDGAAGDELINETVEGAERAEIHNTAPGDGQVPRAIVFEITHHPPPTPYEMFMEANRRMAESFFDPWFGDRRRPGCTGSSESNVEKKSTNTGSSDKGQK